VSAEKLEPGWYWVRAEKSPLAHWEPLILSDDGKWRVPSDGYVLVVPPAIIGPRIEPPVDSGEG